MSEINREFRIYVLYFIFITKFYFFLDDYNEKKLNKLMLFQIIHIIFLLTKYYIILLFCIKCRFFQFKYENCSNKFSRLCGSQLTQL